MSEQQQGPDDTLTSTEVYKLRLFVAGASPNSSHAIENLNEICETYLEGFYEIEIIDVYQQPSIASKEQIIALPLLIKSFPLPVKRLIGSMSDRDKVLKGLEVSY